MRINEVGQGNGRLWGFEKSCTNSMWIRRSTIRCLRSCVCVGVLEFCIGMVGVCTGFYGMQCTIEMHSKD